MTSPYKFYQFWINVDDRDVESYLKLFTLQSRAETDALMAEHNRNPAPRAAQRALATDVTTRVHGADTVKGVVNASAILFAEAESVGAEPAVVEILAEEHPTATVAGETAPLVGWRTGYVVPGPNPFLTLWLDDYPISHSLFTLIVWGALFGYLYRRRSGDKRAAVVIALLVVSHWVLDFVTHRSDEPLYPGG